MNIPTTTGCNVVRWTPNSATREEQETVIFPAGKRYQVREQIEGLPVFYVIADEIPSMEQATLMAASATMLEVLEKLAAWDTERNFLGAPHVAIVEEARKAIKIATVSPEEREIESERITFEQAKAAWIKAQDRFNESMDAWRKSQPSTL